MKNLKISLIILSLMTLLGCATETPTVDKNMDYVIVRYSCVTEENPDLAICIEATTQGKINVLGRPLKDIIPGMNYILGGSMDISDSEVDKIIELSYDESVLRYKASKEASGLENQYAEVFEIYNSKGELIQCIEEAGIIHEGLRALADELYSLPIYNHDFYNRCIQKITDTYDMLK